MKAPLSITGTFALTVLMLCALPAHAEESTRIPLLQPELDGGKPLMQVLQARQSSKEYGQEPVSQQDLSNLLWDCPPALCWLATPELVVLTTDQ